MYLWRQWQNGQNRFKELRRRGVSSSTQRLPPVRRRDSGACQDTRRSNRLCATDISIRSVFPESMCPPKLNSVEPPWCGPVCPVVWEGATLRGVPLSRSIRTHDLKADSDRPDLLHFERRLLTDEPSARLQSVQRLSSFGLKLSFRFATSAARSISEAERLSARCASLSSLGSIGRGSRDTSLPSLSVRMQNAAIRP
jgi:hypothetical protein